MKYSSRTALLNRNLLQLTDLNPKIKVPLNLDLIILRRII